MNLIVNGDPYTFNGSADTVTVADLVTELNLTGRRLAVEVNREIVPKSEHGTHTLREGDTVEVVHAIGGG
jgi:sulfur carrier protein